MPVEIDTKGEAERPTCDWLPIATAPKDGTEVLLWWPYWSRTPTPGHWKHTAWVADRALSIADTPGPTHWQPLPAPPTPRVTCSICRRDDCGGDHPCE
jgi:hypothetical protein